MIAAFWGAVGHASPMHQVTSVKNFQIGKPETLLWHIKNVAQQGRFHLNRKLRQKNLKLRAPVFIRIFKKEAVLEAWVKDGGRYRMLHKWPICTFSGVLGPKLKEGDKQAPEGFYAVGKKQLNPNSRFFLSFNLGYPNEYDRAHGRTGSALMVHGNCVSLGGFAMTDPAIAEIYALLESALKGGQRSVPVHVFPFRLSAANLKLQPKGKWTPFWQNLKEGYDLFLKTKRPPKVSVCGKHYAFGEQGGRCRAISGW